MAILQAIMKDMCNVIDGIIRIITLSPEKVVAKIKRLIANSMESEDRSVWYCWMQYIGVEFESMSEKAQVEAQRQRDEWWSLMASIYNKVVSIMLEAWSVFVSGCITVRQ